MDNFETYRHDKRVLITALVIASIVFTVCIALAAVSFTDFSSFLVTVGIALAVGYVIIADIFSAFTDEDTLTNDIFYASIRGFSMPGLIFEFDLDGIIWFITVKLLLSILSILLSVGWFVLVVAFGSIFAIFTFPFALVRLFSYKTQAK